MTTLPDAPTACQYPDPIPGLLAHGSLSMLAGAPKRGKTALLASWFARIRDGKSICGLPTHQLPASQLGIVTNDHKWHLNQQGWFTKAGFPDIRHYAFRDEPTVWRQLKHAEGRQGLLRCALDHLKLERGGLVALDVITPFITSKVNDYNEVLAGIGELTQVLDVYGLTTVGPAHMGKQKNDPRETYKEPHERILGSGALIGFSDTILYFLGPKDIDESYYLLGWLPTHAPAGEFRFVRDRHGLFIPASALNTPEELIETPIDRLVAAVPTVPPGMLSEEFVILVEVHCGVKRRQARAKISKLLEDRRLVKYGLHHYVRPSPM